MLARKCILVVEDNEINRATLCGLLASEYQILEAENGQEAYERFTSSAPGTYEAVLMDLQMPVMDGCTAARMIRASSHPRPEPSPLLP